MASPKENPLSSGTSSYAKISPYLTRLAHGSAPFIATFLLIHLTAPVLANLGGTSLSSQVMLLGREYYQTSLGEKCLVLGPLAVHTLSSLIKRLVSPSYLRRRLTSILTLTGYATFLFFLPVHLLTHRYYPMDPSPPIYEVGPSELDYEFVKVSLQTWPGRSWFLYTGLTLCVAWHAAEGMRIIWNTTLREMYGAWKGTTMKRLIEASLAVLPVLSGVFVISREPLFAFSSLSTRFEHALSQSFFYRV